MCKFSVFNLSNVPRSFLGNGYVGVGMLSDEPIYIKHGRTLSVPIPFYPVLTSSLVGFPSKGKKQLCFKIFGLEEKSHIAIKHTYLMDGAYTHFLTNIKR